LEKSLGAALDTGQLAFSNIDNIRLYIYIYYRTVFGGCGAKAL
jgi:hypothetical protein